MKLNIVIPCYNEEEVLYETNRQLTELVDSMIKEGLVTECDILYVDDGSKDKTWSIIEELQSVGPYAHGLKLAHNVGHQNALWAGLENSVGQCDAAVSIDADLQDDVKVIVEMVDEFKNEHCEIVYGVRKERKTDTFFKRQTALAFYKLMLALDVDVVYNHADFRLMSSQAIEALMQYPERNIFLRGMVPLIGFKTAKVCYDRAERFAGESKYPLRKMFNFAVDGITSFSVQPLRIITIIGILCVGVSIAEIIYILVAYFNGNVVRGWSSLLFSVWFLGGLLLFSVGIVGEYIGKIYKEVKRRPRYFIEKRI